MSTILRTWLNSLKLGLSLKQISAQGKRKFKSSQISTLPERTITPLSSGVLDQFGSRELNFHRRDSARLARSQNWYDVAALLSSTQSAIYLAAAYTQGDFYERPKQRPQQPYGDNNICWVSSFVIVKPLFLLQLWAARMSTNASDFDSTLSRLAIASTNARPKERW